MWRTRQSLLEAVHKVVGKARANVEHRKAAWAATGVFPLSKEAMMKSVEKLLEGGVVTTHLDHETRVLANGARISLGRESGDSSSAQDDATLMEPATGIQSLALACRVFRHLLHSAPERMLGHDDEASRYLEQLQSDFAACRERLASSTSDRHDEDEGTDALSLVLCISDVSAVVGVATLPHNCVQYADYLEEAIAADRATKLRARAAAKRGEELLQAYVARKDASAAPSVAGKRKRRYDAASRRDELKALQELHRSLQDEPDLFQCAGSCRKLKQISADLFAFCEGNPGCKGGWCKSCASKSRSQDDQGFLAPCKLCNREARPRPPPWKRVRPSTDDESDDCSSAVMEASSAMEEG